MILRNLTRQYWVRINCHPDLQDIIIYMLVKRGEQILQSNNVYSKAQSDKDQTRFPECPLSIQNSAFRG